MPDPIPAPDATAMPMPMMEGQMTAGPMAEPMVQHVRRDATDTPEEAKALVTLLCERVKEAKNFHEKAFKRMREDMRFLKGMQWYGQTANDDRYVANITLRQLTQHVAALYAKNPRFICRRRPSLDFAVWDETAASLMNLQSEMVRFQATGQIDPNAAALMQDLQAGQMRKQMTNRVARSLELVMKYQIDQQIPPFKKQMKQLVRRTLTTSVGFLKLGFQRAFQPRPEDVEKINDCRERILEIQRILEDMKDGEESDGTQEMLSEKARLEAMILALQSQDNLTVNEGLVFDFPRSTAIIVDPCCTQLDGFLGAKFVAQEYLLTKEDIERIYEVDIGNTFTSYIDSDQGIKPMPLTPEENKSKGRVCVWEVYSKTEELCYVVADGYPDFLRKPAPPAVKLRRFWPFFALTFNQVEDDTEKGLYPQSDVALMRPMQCEYNRSRERLREHRNANTPKMATPRGALEESDKIKLQSDIPGVIVELNNLNPGQKVLDILQPIIHPPVDPALYDTAHLFDDIQRVSGAAEANLGGTSGATATESSIAEASRTTGIASNQDDLDDFLTEVARESGQVLLSELNPETAKYIAGPGAAWPDAQQSRDEIVHELYLEIEAGSSGKPNRAQEIGNFERMAPILIQIPGISPEWFAKKAVAILDDKLDVSEALLAGAQAIVAQNRMAQVSTGNPATDPNAQGPQGASNAPAPPGGPSPMQQDQFPVGQPKLYGIAKGEAAAA